MGIKIYFRGHRDKFSRASEEIFMGTEENFHGHGDNFSWASGEIFMGTGIGHYGDQYSFRCPWRGHAMGGSRLNAHPQKTFPLRHGWIIQQ